MTQPTRQPTPWANSAMSGRQRLGYFMIGAAVSCVLIGLYMNSRSRFREQARDAKLQQQGGIVQPPPPPGVPLRPKPPAQ